MKLMTKLLIFIGLSLLVSNITFAEGKLVPEFIDGTTRVNAEQMIELVDKYANLVIVDSRKASDYEKGYIEGSSSLPDTQTSAESLHKVIDSKQTPVVFYCNGVKCGRSLKAAKVAIDSGYKLVYWFRGGMEEWEAKGLPVVFP